MITTVRRAFTLIELLVVITILVVLLALLAPAMDRAVYQAELAVCGTRLHGISNGAASYALSFHRMYPARQTPWWPQQLSNPYAGDDRPMLHDYLPMNEALLCPLVREIDLANTTTDAANRIVLAYSSYALWFGFVYTVAGVEAAPMRKLGDRWTYNSPQISVSSDLLAMDSDVTDEVNGYAFTSHPDWDGVLAPWSLDNTVWDNAAGVVITGGVRYAFSWWLETGALTRGPIDNNYLHSDGSVGRIGDVKFIDRAKEMVQLPLYLNGQGDWRIQTPTR